MSCPYMASETRAEGKGKNRTMHTREYCLGSNGPCLIDSEADRAGCTRRAFMDLQAEQARPPRATKGPGDTQLALL